MHSSQEFVIYLVYTRLEKMRSVIPGRSLGDDSHQRRMIHIGDRPWVQGTRHATLHSRPERKINAEEQSMRAATNAGSAAMLKRQGQ